MSSRAMKIPHLPCARAIRVARGRERGGKNQVAIEDGIGIASLIDSNTKGSYLNSARSAVRKKEGRGGKTMPREICPERIEGASSNGH